MESFQEYWESHRGDRHLFRIERLDAHENYQMLDFSKTQMRRGKKDCLSACPYFNPHSIVWPDHPTARFVFEFIE
jgi:hypothetical protein